MKPLARLTVKRQRVYEKTCGLPPVKGVIQIDDPRPECAVTEYGEFTPCSVTCGKGLKGRKRYYKNPAAAKREGCHQQLEETEMCPAPIPICPEDDEPSYCKTTNWGSWSPCSVTCGKGFMKRTRRFKDPMGRKRCNTQTEERQMCLSSVVECSRHNSAYSKNITNPECTTTQWTDWSPCSVTCGSGVRVRRREYIMELAAATSNCNEEMYLKEKCEGARKDCNFNEGEAKEVCMEPKEPGPCRGYFPRYYYDAEKGICMQFTYGGCRANLNNFENFYDCSSMCEGLGLRYPIDSSNFYPESDSVFIHPPPTSSSADYNQHVHAVTGGTEKRRCVLSEWSNWSTCTNTCGNDGKKYKTRHIIVESAGGARPCSKKLKRQKKCKLAPCQNAYSSRNEERHSSGLEVMSQVFDPYHEFTSPVFSPYNLNHNLDDGDNLPLDDYDDVKSDCVMGEWGPWSPCTHSCGSTALQQRSRSIISKPRGGGAACGPRLQRRFCTLPPCPHPRG